MARRAGILVICLLLGAATLGAWRWIRRAEPSEPAARIAESAPPPVRAPPDPRGRPAPAPDAELLAAARALLGRDGRREPCGPYALHTDVRDPRLIQACGRLASRLDALYEERYGVRPVGKPAEAVVLFAEQADYRNLARGQGVSPGYAGYAIPARGLAIFHAGGEPFETFLTTLAHELTHLVNRRALGINLPPWLSEGLADGLGDTATADGFVPLEGLGDGDVAARRLRSALASGRAGSLKRLTSLTRREFDRGVVSFDYEQSALFVRFLLAEPELRTDFRRFLSELADGGSADPERLRGALGISWDALDRRFAAWVEALGPRDSRRRGRDRPGGDHDRRLGPAPGDPRTFRRVEGEIAESGSRRGLIHVAVRNGRRTTRSLMRLDPPSRHARLSAEGRVPGDNYPDTGGLRR